MSGWTTDELTVLGRQLALASHGGAPGPEAELGMAPRPRRRNCCGQRHRATAVWLLRGLAAGKDGVSLQPFNGSTLHAPTSVVRGSRPAAATVAGSRT